MQKDKSNLIKYSYETINLFFLTSIMFFGISCSKDNANSNDSVLKGQIFFYTNAQALLNCGPFNVDIYIDSVLMGSISNPCLIQSLHECYQSDSTILIEKKQGTVDYYAVANCGDYGIWSGSINVKSDSCIKIFLNIKDLQNVNQTIKYKLIGKWIEISPCDSCHILTFGENDTIYQISRWDNTILSAFYQVITEDSIKVIRNWEIETEKKTTKHKLIFHAIDTLEIKQFIPVDYGITGFEDIKLYKTNKP